MELETYPTTIERIRIVYRDAEKYLLVEGLAIKQVSLLRSNCDFSMESSLMNYQISYDCAYGKVKESTNASLSLLPN